MFELSLKNKMTKTYKNMQQLCNDHRAPKLDYSRQDIGDILQQYYAFIYHRYHSIYKENNPNYRQILDIIEHRMLDVDFTDNDKSFIALIDAINDIKRGPLNVLQNSVLAPHVILRSYNLFNSLLESVTIHLINSTPIPHKRQYKRRQK